MSETTCDRCGQDVSTDLVEDISLSSDWTLCEPCVDRLDRLVKDYDWKDRYTEEQHERAVSLLSERSEFECVIDSYERGQIIVHTPYVSSKVVADFCQHFGFEVASFNPIWLEQSEWPCVDSHDSIFQIVLEYNHRCKPPVPINTTFDEYYTDNLDGSDRQF
jgi:hypothetical protein